MNLLRIILQSKLFYLIFLTITVLNCILRLKIIQKESFYKENETLFYGTIEKIKQTNYGYSFILNGKEKLICYIDNFEYEMGDYVKITGSLSIPYNNTILNSFNYHEYLKQNRINFILNVEKIELIHKNKNIIYKIKNKIINYLNTFKSKAYLKTFLLGDTSYLEDNIYESYQINGICHLLSIGSMHITILSFIILKCLKKFKINIAISNSILLLNLFLYLLFMDYPIVVIRIFLYKIFSFLNNKKKLKLGSIKIFFITLIIPLLINPNYIYQKGFLYSYYISFLLILNKEQISKNYFNKLFKISLISFMGSIPFNIYFNYSINLLSSFYNLIFVPIFNFLVFPLALFTFIFPFLDNLYYILINLINSLSISLNNISFGVLILKKMNFIILIIYLILFIFVTTDLLKKKKYSIFLIIIVLVIHFNINLFTKESFFIALDVGQGDSGLLYNNNESILIDTGGLYYKDISHETINMLKSLGIRKLNTLILTHGDYDHMGESVNLVNNFKVEKVIFNCGPYNDLEKALIKVLDKKKIKYYSCINELNIDDKKLYFLQTKEYDNENDNSNVIYTELNGYKLLFTGDASITTEKEILSKYNLPDIDVLKVGHHGSRTSSSIEFIDEINPKYSIISVGKNNRYGHPNKEVLENLNNSKIYRTDEDGSIMFKIKNNKLNVETCSP